MFTPVVDVAETVLTFCVWFTYVIGPFTAAFCLNLVNLLFGKKPPPATAVPASAAIRATIATMMAALGRRFRILFIELSLPIACVSPPTCRRRLAPHLGPGRRVVWTLFRPQTETQVLRASLVGAGLPDSA